MKSLFTTLVIFVTATIWAIPNASGTKNLHPATGLPLVDLVQSFGYPIEVHENIRTEDGYLLTIHRIPYGVTNVDQPKKGVVLLMHCLMCSAAIFASHGPEKGLAYILADQGYDVWMPNARGTYFSRKHVTLDPEDDASKFWRFSWHQIGYYDLPASIDYIKQQTGVEQMFYVGYSQGTTSFFVLATDRPEYNNVFKLSVSLAPSVYFENTTNDLYRFMGGHIDAVNQLMESLGWHEFLPKIELMDELAQFCRGVGHEFCIDLFFSIFGMDSVQLEQNWLPVFGTHFPAGCATKQFMHYGQIIGSAKFRRFDFGLVGNLAEYGTITPPEYDLNKVNTPVALFYGAKDDISVTDVEKFADDLPNVVHLQLIDDPYFTHVDFVLSVDVVELVYNHVLAVMSKF